MRIGGIPIPIIIFGRLLRLLTATHNHYDHHGDHSNDSHGNDNPHPSRNALVCLWVNIRTGIDGGRCLRHRDLHRRFLALLLAIGILVCHLQFGIIFAGRISGESESNGAGSAGCHIADVLRGLRGGDAVTFDGRFDVGHIPLAFVHIFHGNSGFFTSIDGVGKHGITQFEAVRLRNRYGNLNIRSVGVAGVAIDILVFEVDIDALRAVLRARQHLHGHGLRQRVTRP